MASGFSLLRNRALTAYLAGRFLATLAVQMQGVAIGWQVYQITGSVFDLGLVGLAQFAPFLLWILPAGHVADRYDRRRIIILCVGAQLACGLMLWAFSAAQLRVVWPVLAILSVYGSARAFMMPATQAFLVKLVPPQDFGQAVAIGSSSFQVATIAGPTLGGLLYLAGPDTVYMCTSILLMLGLALLCFVPRPEQTPNTEPMSWHTVFEGLRFVWAKPVVLGALSLDLFAVLFGGATALLPAFAHDVLHAGPTALGLLRTMPGAGAALCSVVLAFWPVRRRVGAWMFGGVAVFGVSTLVLGATDSIPVALIALFLLGAGDMVSVYIRHLLVQLETPDAIRGRVSAVNAVFIGASNELGEFESGLTAHWMGLVRAILFGGCATLAVTGIWYWRFRDLSHMDRLPEHAPH